MEDYGYSDKFGILATTAIRRSKSPSATMTGFPHSEINQTIPLLSVAGSGDQLDATLGQQRGDERVVRLNPRLPVTRPKVGELDSSRAFDGVERDAGPGDDAIDRLDAHFSHQEEKNRLSRSTIPRQPGQL